MIQLRFILIFETVNTNRKNSLRPWFSIFLSLNKWSNQYQSNHSISLKSLSSNYLIYKKSKKNRNNSHNHTATRHRRQITAIPAINPSRHISHILEPVVPHSIRRWTAPCPTSTVHQIKLALVQIFQSSFNVRHRNICWPFNVRNTMFHACSNVQKDEIRVALSLIDDLFCLLCTYVGVGGHREILY